MKKISIENFIEEGKLTLVYKLGNYVMFTIRQDDNFQLAVKYFETPKYCSNLHPIRCQVNLSGIPSKRKAYGIYKELLKEKDCFIRKDRIEYYRGILQKIEFQAFINAEISREDISTEKWDKFCKLQKEIYQPDYELDY